MQAFVQVTFDLEGAESQDYINVQEGFQGFHLADCVYSSAGQPVALPYNTFAGEYLNVRDLREFSETIAVAVRDVFEECRVTGRAFLLCAGADTNTASGYLWRSLTF